MINYKREKSGPETPFWHITIIYITHYIVKKAGYFLTSSSQFPIAHSVYGFL